jgi:Ca2+-binding RTX toxin-like protein
MTITITAGDWNGDGVGIDFAGYLADFVLTYAPSGFGYFSSDAGDFSGPQFANTEQGNLVVDTTKQSVVFEAGGGGNSIDYTFATHTVGGDLDAMSFGYGLTYDSGTDSFPLTNLDLRISGFGFVNQTGEGNVVSEMLNDVIPGSVSTDTLTGVLSANEINFVGSGGDDVFTGYAQDDTLAGGGGNDTLSGAGGTDTLEGGAGDDTYVVQFAAGQGDDHIIDADGTNSIVVGTTQLNSGTGETEVVGYSLEGTAELVSGETDIYELILEDGEGADQTYHLQWSGSGDLVITNTAVPGVSVTVEDFTNGSFGLTLDNSEITLTSGDDTFIADGEGLTQALNINGGDGNDYISTSNIPFGPGYPYADTVNGGNGNDLIITGVGNDTVDGGAGDDIIAARGGTETVIGGTGDDTFVLRFFGNASSATTDTGTTTITDDDGVLWNGSVSPDPVPAAWTATPTATQGFVIAGTATVVTPGEWDLEVPNDSGGSHHLTLTWSGGDLTIVGGTETAIIKDYVNGTFGITLENAGPVAQDDTASTVKNVSKIIDVLGNDNDVDGTLNAGTVTIVDNPTNGFVAKNAETGEIMYTPAVGYVGADSFTYTVTDNDGAVSNTATVNLDVASSITLTSGDDVFIADGQGMTAALEIYGGDGNDYISTSNIPGGPGFPYADNVTGGNGNDLIITGSGNDTVDGGAGDDIIAARGGTETVIGGTGNDTFVLRFFGNASSGTTDTGTTTITDNDGTLWNGSFRPATLPEAWASSPPSATAGFLIAGTATRVSAGVWDLAVADDTGGTKHLTLNWTGDDLTIAGGNETVIIKDYVNGTFGITLAAPSGDAPVTRNDDASTVKNVSTVIDVLANDTDADGTLNPATVNIVDGPDHGTLSIDDLTGEITYTPTVGYVGADSFTYTVNDDEDWVSNAATVDIDVAGSLTLTSKDDVFIADGEGMTAALEIYGGNGNDYISTSNIPGGPGFPYADTVYGGNGNDLIITGSGNDTVDGGAGNDIIAARGGTETVIGGTGDDTFVLRFFGNASSATTDTGTTTITDTDGVLWNGSFRPATLPAAWASSPPSATAGFVIAGTASFVSEGEWELEVPNDTGGTHVLDLSWSGGDLTIVGGNETVIIKNYENGTFGINLDSTGVTGNGVDIADGDSTPGAGDGTDFGLNAVGDLVEHTFTVTNNGPINLKTSGLKLPAGFKLAKGEKLDATIAPGESDTFKVVLDTKKVGTFSGVVTFKTNDASHASYEFTVTADVAAPEIAVSGNGADIRDNDKTPSASDDTNFGDAAFGSAPVVRTFTIENTGGLPLNISSVVVPTGFTLVGGFPATIAANSSETIQVRLDVNATGIHKGDIVITSDDSNEAVFNFTVQGNVTPEVVTGDGSSNTFVAGDHAEAFDGLGGSDTVSYEDATEAVVANLQSPNGNKGFAAGDKYVSVENLTGSDFNDTLTGNAEDNVLEGGEGADKLTGGSGSDTASYANASAGVTANLLKSTLNTGEAEGDKYSAIENLLGSANDDMLVGDTKVNALTGGDGADTLVGNGGIDTLTGGADADVFMFNAIKDGGGATKVSLTATGDLITDFVSGADKVGIQRLGFKIGQGVDLGTGDADDFAAHYFVSGDGSDPLTTANQSGVAATETGHGQFLFNEDTDQLWWDSDGTGNAKAVLLATFNTDIVATDFELFSRNIRGDGTDNTLVATADPDGFFGLGGSDTVSYEDATEAVVANLQSPNGNKGFAAGDSYNSIENLTGSDFNDTLTGNAGDNVLQGGLGADKLTGGAGSDTASYADATDGVLANLLKSTLNEGEAEGDKYSAIENLLGSAHDDELVGDTKINTLTGGAGEDTLVGNGGIDTLFGGDDADIFMFNAIKDGGGATKATLTATGDMIMDFVSGTDSIGISLAGFKIDQSVGGSDFTSHYFVSGDGSDPLTTANQSGVAATETGHGQFLFNQATDQLWWDSDGTGNAKAVLLATLNTDITAADFSLFYLA